MLKMRSICKQFEEEQVLHDIFLDIQPGEIHALIGPNGSGKSTIAKILSGAIQQDSGTILIDGQTLNNRSPADTRQQGVFMIYQEHYLVPSMSVLDNMFLGNYSTQFGIFVKKNKIRKMAINVLKSFDSTISVNREVGHLSIGEQYVVSVAKAFVQNAKLYIFDEPTAGLSQEEREVVYKLISRLRDNGAAVLYITHRINEVHCLCDRVTIMRDGHIIITADVKSISQKAIVHQLEVCDSEKQYKVERFRLGENVLTVRDLCKEKAYRNISFSLQKSEILGIVGNRGSGRSALLKTLFGAIQQDSGEIWLYGKKIRKHSIEKSILNYQIGYLADERLQYGIIPNMNVVENSMIPRRKVQKSFFVRKGEERDWFIETLVSEGYFLPDPTRSIQSMSGGNQQKTLFFRWIAANSKIILLDEPTKGIDIASKNEIYAIIQQSAHRGVSFIMCSSDIEELEPICSRILTIKNGSLKEYKR